MKGRPEALFVKPPDQTVHPIGADDQIGLRDLIQAGHFMMETKLDPELRASLLEDSQQLLASHPRERVAA